MVEHAIPGRRLNAEPVNLLRWSLQRWVMGVAHHALQLPARMLGSKRNCKPGWALVLRIINKRVITVVWIEGCSFFTRPRYRELVREWSGRWKPRGATFPRSLPPCPQQDLGSYRALKVLPPEHAPFTFIFGAVCVRYI